MGVLTAFQNNEITLNEARLALGLPPDESWGKLYHFQLFSSHVYGTKALHAQADAFVDQLGQLHSDTEETFAQELQAFFRKWKESILDALRDTKSIEPKRFNQLRKSVVNKIYREKQHFAKLVTPHFKNSGWESGTLASDLCAQMGITDDPTFDSKAWEEKAEKLAKEMAQRLTERFRQESSDLFAKAKQEGWDEERLRTEMNALWERIEERARRITETEIHYAKQAAVEQAFHENGATGKMWRAEQKGPCPFCRAMNGRVYPLFEDFLSIGDVVQGTTDEGKIREMRITYRNVPHPPIHPNCKCSIVPYKEGVTVTLEDIEQEEDVELLDAYDPEDDIEEVEVTIIPPDQVVERESTPIHPMVIDVGEEDIEPIILPNRPPGVNAFQRKVYERLQQGNATVQDKIDIGELMMEEKQKRLQGATVTERWNLNWRKSSGVTETEISYHEMEKKLDEAWKVQNGGTSPLFSSETEAELYFDYNIDAYLAKRAEVHEQLLSEVRDLGYPKDRPQWVDDTLFNGEYLENADPRYHAIYGPADKKVLENILAEIQHLYPREWWERSVDEPVGIHHHAAGGIGGYVNDESALRANLSQPVFLLNMNNPPEHRNSMIHEMGHRFQDMMPELRQLEQDYLIHRAGEWKEEPLNDIARRNGATEDPYPPEYVGVDGKFPHSYMSRVYSDRTTELITTSLEYLFGTDKYRSFVHYDLRSDPETEKFIWGLLVGL